MVRNNQTKKDKEWVPVRMFALLIALSLTILLAGCGLADKSSEISAADADKGEENVTDVLEGGDLVIPVSDVSETPEFYSVDVDGTKMEVIAVKASDGSVRTAFNTCQVCYDSGRGYYKLKGNALVCQNCGNRFSMDQIEVQSGGCNPVPILSKNKEVTEEAITISYDYLNEAKSIFANWKTSY